MSKIPLQKLKTVISPLQTRKLANISITLTRPHCKHSITTNKVNKHSSNRFDLAFNTMAAPTNTQYQIPSLGAPLQRITNPLPPLPTPTSLIIRLKSIAINPADVKMIDHGHRGVTYPFIPGLDGSGIVFAVGDHVTRFKEGDEVLALFNTGKEKAAFQEFAVVEEDVVARMPRGWGFDESASVGFVY